MVNTLAQESFDLNGFYLTNAIIDQTLLAQSENAVNDVLNGIYDSGIPPLYSVNVLSTNFVNRIGQIHYSNEILRQLICTPALGRIIADISGATRVTLWGSQLYYKPSHHSPNCQIGFHRDSQHLPGILRGGFTVWIPLTEMTEASGAIRYIVGSHRWNKSIKPSGAQDVDLNRQLLDLTRQLDGKHCEEYSVRIKPGRVAIHDQETIHASLCNVSGKPRVAIAASVITDKTVFEPSTDIYGIREILEDPTRSYEFLLQQNSLKTYAY